MRRQRRACRRARTTTTNARSTASAAIGTSIAVSRPAIAPAIASVSSEQIAAQRLALGGTRFELAARGAEHPRDRDELEASGPQRGHQPLDRLQRLRAVAAAVVHEHDPAALAARSRVAHDLGGARSTPVLGVEVGERDEVAALCDRPEVVLLAPANLRPESPNRVAEPAAGGSPPRRRSRTRSARAAGCAPNPRRRRGRSG